MTFNALIGSRVASRASRSKKASSATCKDTGISVADNQRGEIVRMPLLLTAVSSTMGAMSCLYLASRWTACIILVLHSAAKSGGSNTSAETFSTRGRGKAGLFIPASSACHNRMYSSVSRPRSTLEYVSSGRCALCRMSPGIFEQCSPADIERESAVSCHFLDPDLNNLSGWSWHHILSISEISILNAL